MQEWSKINFKFQVVIVVIASGGIDFLFSFICRQTPNFLQWKYSYKKKKKSKNIQTEHLRGKKQQKYH